MNKKLFVFIFLPILFFSVFSFSLLFANTQPYNPITTGAEGTGLIGSTNAIESVGTFVKGAFRLGIAAAIILSVIMIIFGGLQTMTTDSVFKKEEGMNKVKSAIYGLLLALCTIAILATINPKIVEFKLDFGKTDVKVEKINTEQQRVSGTNQNTSTGTNNVPPKDVFDDSEIELPTDPTSLDDGASMVFERSSDSTFQDFTGIKENTITGLINIQNQSGVKKIPITGFNNVSGREVFIEYKNFEGSDGQKMKSYFDSLSGTINKFYINIPGTDSKTYIEKYDNGVYLKF